MRVNDKDILSQQEIDALLSRNQGISYEAEQAEKQAEDGHLQANKFLTDLEQDALGEIGNISFGTAATALSALLRQKVEITTPSVSIVTREHLAADFPLPHVTIKVEYTDGLVGANVLVIRIQDAKVIADLMMGGDGTHVDESELNDLHLSAVAEAMNQMMGSAATSLSTIFNMMVNISPPKVEIVDFSQPHAVTMLADEDVIVKISFRLIVGQLIDSNIMQLIPLSFARTMLSKLSMSGSDSHQAEKEAAAAPAPNSSRAAADPMMRSMEDPVQTAQSTIPPSPSTPEPAPVPVQPVQFASFDPPSTPPVNARNLDMLLDVSLQVTVELGRTKKEIREILQLAPGSIIELDKVAGEPVDILVNQKLIAKGEVVVIDENFGVRVTDIITPSERIKKLNH